MAKIVRREKEEYPAGVFFIVEDEDGRIGTVHKTFDESRIQAYGSRFISRDCHIPSRLKPKNADPHAYFGTKMKCRFHNNKIAYCDGSSLVGLSPNASDEEAFALAASMIDAEPVANPET